MIYRPVDNDFAEWAFGADLWFDFLVWDKDSIDLFHAWNDRHGDLYHLHEDEDITASMRKMKQLYEGQKDVKTKPSKTKTSAKQSRTHKIPKSCAKVDAHLGMGADENTNKVKPIRGKNGQENAQSNRVDENGRQRHCERQAKDGGESAQGRREEE